MPSALARCLLLCSITAAMGPQDCGQCGYSWQDYSDATVARNKRRVIFCVPGGEQARLEAPRQGFSSPAPSSATIRPAIPTPADATAAVVAAPGCGRRHLAKPRFRFHMRLNRQVSGKETLHEKRGRQQHDVH
jgi:hypothetical protein